MTIFRPFFTALRFLTILPLSRGIEKDHLYMSKSLLWFPFVGLLIGLGCASISLGLEFLIPHQLTSVIVVLMLGLASGFLHYDGLADAADGFFSSRPKPQMLEIMRDSRIGVMGCIALIFVIICKIFSFNELNTDIFLYGIILTPLTGRLSLLIQMEFLPYLRKESGGAASLFCVGGKSRVLLLTLFVSVVWFLFFGFKGFICQTMIAFTNLLYILYCKKKINGSTGDTLGAGCELTETATVLSLTFL